MTMFSIDGSSICQGSGFTGESIMPESGVNNAWVNMYKGRGNRDPL